jgi:hypothetical protein
LNKLTEVSAKYGYKATCNHYCKLIYPLSWILLIFLLISPVQAKYSGGTGEPNDPYRIATPNDLNDIGNHVEDFNKCFVMVNDINLADYTGTQFNIIGNYPSEPFTGVFDGNSHIISNFNYNSTGTRHIAIFGYVTGSDSLINNLCIVDPNVNAGTGWRAGPVFGMIIDGTVSNCFVEGGRVSGRIEVGGLGGVNFAGLIFNCSSTTDIYGEDHAGGLLGGNTLDGLVSNCFATCEVSAGGFNDEVSGVGGLIGVSYGTISNCYSSGDVSGINRPTGGLIGNCRYASVLNCYASGGVSGTSGDIGGLVGNSYSSSYIKCFWDNTMNPTLAGGVSEPNVVGKSTAEMMEEATFTSWDFVEVWNIGENQTYPYLRIYPAGDLNHDGIVNGLDFAIFANHWLEDNNP